MTAERSRPEIDECFSCHFHSGEAPGSHQTANGNEPSGVGGSAALATESTAAHGPDPRRIRTGIAVVTDAKRIRRRIRILRRRPAGDRSRDRAGTARRGGGRSAGEPRSHVGPIRQLARRPPVEAEPPGAGAERREAAQRIDDRIASATRTATRIATRTASRNETRSGARTATRIATQVTR